MLNVTSPRLLLARMSVALYELSEKTLPRAIKPNSEPRIMKNMCRELHDSIKKKNFQLLLVYPSLVTLFRRRSSKQKQKERNALDRDLCAMPPLALTFEPQKGKKNHIISESINNKHQREGG
jgi:hypothetical protein